MDTQRVHHTDYSYPFNWIGTNAQSIVNCSLKNRRTRVESNKLEKVNSQTHRFQPRCWRRSFRTNTDLGHTPHRYESMRCNGSKVLCWWVLYRTVPPPIIYRVPVPPPKKVMCIMVWKMENSGFGCLEFFMIGKKFFYHNKNSPTVEDGRHSELFLEPIFQGVWRWACTLLMMWSDLSPCGVVVSRLDQKLHELKFWVYPWVGGGTHG
jgi:hypothetical protein